MPAITDQQWAAARAIAEGLPGTHALIAACMGVHATTVSHRSAQDRWEAIDYRHARIRRAMADVAELSRRIRAGEALDPVERGEPVGHGDPVEHGEPETGRAVARFGGPSLPAEPEPWPDAPPAERMARIGAVLTRQTETMLRRMEVGRPLEARQVAALTGLVALAERIAALAQQETRQQDEVDQDELRDTYRAIDLRIMYLAQCQAREIAIQLFGITREEVDEKLPEPVDRSQEVLRRRRAAGRRAPRPA